MDSFNIHQYTPPRGYFSIDCPEVFEVNWNIYDNEFNPSNSFRDDRYNVTKCMRAVVEPLLISHFGDAIIDEVFCRYKEIISDHISKENTQFINVTSSTIKRG
ncbi:salicylate carboxymethyltransferase [Quercus suber]|uniref:Salicylate carboxymethyltransferase n=1 Tax=Quercus suber TaxID=58331 RepID=A0AAW0KKM1_QUESU